MTNNKRVRKSVLRKALFSSAISLILCCAMLVGTTFAWFTDSVTSSNNIIKSGTLDVTMEWKDATATGEQQDYKDASEGPIFDYDLWEPGYVEAKNIKIGNKGTLALKYMLNILANGEVSILSDVIDVYFADGEIKLANRTMSQLTRIGTLTEILQGMPSNTNGDLTAGESDIVTIALKMQETANNDYQNLSIGSDFSVQLLATQLTYEKDSFDNQYDKLAPWTGNVPNSLEDTTLEIVPGGGSQTGTITINSAEDLVYLNKLAKEWVSLYSNGQGTNVDSYRENVSGKGTDYYYHWTWDIKLAANLDMNNAPMDSVDISYWDTFDGNGHTISNVNLKYGQDGLFNNGAKAINNLTVKNITVNAPEAQTVGAIAGNGAMTNVHVENATVIGGKYVGGICGKGSSFVNCSIKNSTVTGTDKTVGGLVGYSIGDPNAATVSGNTVDNVTVIGTFNVGGMLGQSQNETVENNTVKNSKVYHTAASLPTDASANEVLVANLAARCDFANTTIGTNTVENVITDYAPDIADGDDAALDAALNAGDSYIMLGNGEYTADIYDIAVGESLTITGNGNTKLSFNNLQVRASQFKEITISNCIIERMPNKSWGHLVFGSSTTPGGVYTISNCTFNGVGSQGIYINQTVPATFNIENCTFNGDFGGEGAITIQNNDDVNITVNVTDCKFNNIPTTSHDICVLYAYDGWTLNADGVTAFWKANP